MKKLFLLMGLLAIMALITLPVSAATLYEQEGQTSDGYATINASGQGPGTNPNSTNWKYQYGGGSWSGVYSWGTGWVEETIAGDEDLDIEADIELYCATTTSNNKIYFHLGNIYSATAADKTAYVTGTLVSNNGEWIGISFDGTSKTEASFEKVGGNFTGVIKDAMVGTIDGRNQDISSEKFDVRILLSWGAGWQVPGNWGGGADGTIPNALWWDVNNHLPGSYNLTWQVTLLPGTHQADGNYHLDPKIVTIPGL